MKDNRAILRLVPDARPGAPSGPLHGVRVAIKDCIDVEGLPTTVGTRFLNMPAAADATIVRRLRAAGAVIYAKTNMHEFGIQPTGINPHHGTPVNAFDPNRIPGGSSSGSAVAVASGIVPMAIGTDAGGSIRVPAALNGLVGLKPTFGAVPLDGIAQLTRDLDHCGPIARTVEDATTLFEVIAARSIDRTARASSPALLKEMFENTIDGVGDAVRKTARDVFGDLPEVSSPASAWAAAVEFVIVGTDAQETCADYLRDHGDELAPDTRIILRLGGGLTADDRRRADRLRTAMRDEIDRLLEKHDVLIGPATGCLAPRLHASARRSGELDTVTLAQLAAQSFVTNLTGHPSLVVPCGRIDGQPVAMQFIARNNAESVLFALGLSLQNTVKFYRPQT